MQRNNVENNSSEFDWTNLITHYYSAYDRVLTMKAAKNVNKKPLKKAAKKKSKSK